MFGEVHRAVQLPVAYRYEVVERRSHWCAGIDPVAAGAVEQRVEREHLDGGWGVFGAAERHFGDVHLAAQTPSPLKNNVRF